MIAFVVPTRGVAVLLSPDPSSELLPPIQHLVDLSPLILVQLTTPSHRLGPLASVFMPQRRPLRRPLRLPLHPHLLVILVDLPVDLRRQLCTLLLLDPTVRFALDLRDALRFRLRTEHQLAHLAHLRPPRGDFFRGEVIHLELFRLREVLFPHFGLLEELVHGTLELCRWL